MKGSLSGEACLLCLGGLKLAVWEEGGIDLRELTILTHEGFTVSSTVCDVVDVSCAMNIPCIESSRAYIESSSVSALIGS